MTSIFDRVMNSSQATTAGDRTIRQGETSRFGYRNTGDFNRAAPPHVPDVPVAPPPVPEEQSDDVPQRHSTAVPQRHHTRLTPAEQANQDFLAAKVALEQAKLVSQTVSSINSRWKDDNILAADGNNFAQWTRELRETGSSHLNDADFFFVACSNSTFEKIGCLVIFASVHQSLVSDIQRFKKTDEIYTFLKKKFSVISRAAQMNVWHRFMAVVVNPDTPSTTVATQIRDLYTELNSLNARMSSDTFFGFLFQSAVMRSSAPFKRDFEQRIENGMQNDPHKSVPRFEVLVNNYDICQKQWDDYVKSNANATSGPVVPTGLLADAETSDFDFDAFLADVPEENWSEALEFFAATASRCWQCRSTEHYLRDCPQRARPNPINKKARGPGTPQFSGTSHRQLATFVGSLYTQPSNSTNSSGPTAPLARFQNQAKRMADFYRPRYNNQSAKEENSQSQHWSSDKGGASAHMIELGNVPDDLDDLDFRNMSLGEDLVSELLIFDTGASHHFSGSRSILHDFRSLSKPLPLSVATTTNQSFITGVGNIKMKATNGNIIVLKGVLYCEQARSNLISMAALRKANAYVCYDNTRDTFEIFNQSGDMAFACTLDRKKNRWYLPYPLLRSGFGRSNSPQTVSVFLSNANIPSSNVPSDKSLSHTSLSLSDVSPGPQLFSETISNLTPSSQKSASVSFSHDLIPDLNAASQKFNGDDLFKEPVNKAEGIQWHPESLSREEKVLLFWHRVFGHASLRALQKLIKDDLGHGLPKELPKGTIHCPVCAISKSTAVNPLSTTDRVVDRLEILAVDLIGPFEVEAIDGAKYLFTMRDVATGYCFVKPIKAKSDSNKVIMDTIVRLERITGKAVKILRSDNGGEFINKALAEFLTTRGIGTERALPYHHYQNGMIERFNRTVQAMGRTILIDSSLSKSFWNFAFIWAGHILNRLPNKTSGKITPYEALFRIKPHFDRFRAFGSYAYVHVTTENRLKLDGRALQGQVVAHLETSKGWTFWIPSENRFVNSALVRFVNNEHNHFATLGKLGDDLDIDQRDPKEHIDPAFRDTSAKIDVDFVMSLMQLGDFTREIEFHDQELIVDKITQLCDFYAISIPKTFKQAMKSPEKDAWSKAIAVELNNLEQMRVWLVRLMPGDKKALNGRWVFATKPDVDGSGVRFKARFVAKGFTQVAGLDFNETFAPTATFVALRLLLTVAAARNWAVHSFDFVAAYLNSPIDEEVWVKPPEGLDVPKGHSLLLQKALYGTRQAARCWWLHLRGVLDKLGYSPSQYDNSLYILRHPDEHGVVWLHVDDGVVTASDESFLKKLEHDLKDILKIKWSSSLDSIVGLNVERSEKGFQLYQKELINQLLETEWDGVTTTKTPLPANYAACTDPDGEPGLSGKYLSIIGSLSYLAVGTRPDICYAVNFLARFAAKPGKEHWKGVKHLINYLGATRDQRLTLFPKMDDKPLKTFCDASWGGEFSRSAYGVFTTFFNCPVLWIARRQQSVASSTCHAEYMALGIATRQTLWVRHLLRDVLKKDYVGHLHCDNQSTVRVATDDASNKRTRHSDRDFYITNESLFQKKTTLTWVPTTEQLADVFTKCLSPDLFHRLRAHIMGNI
jgi:transposase InsO family protein